MQVVPCCCQLKSKLRSQFLGPLCLWQCFIWSLSLMTLFGCPGQSCLWYHHHPLHHAATGPALAYGAEHQVAPLCITADFIFPLSLPPSSSSFSSSSCLLFSNTGEDAAEARGAQIRGGGCLLLDGKVCRTHLNFLADKLPRTSLLDV